MDYKSFLEKKTIVSKDTGFTVNRKDLNNNLFEYQKDIVIWALKKGKSAIFADCGLGKSLMQLEWAEKVHEETNGSILILAPLAVTEQTYREGIKFGINSKVVECQEDVINGINITNYEKLDKFDTSVFNGIVLDESSILKSFTGKVRNQIIDNFKNTPYKLACTATPAPNDYMELGNHSEFLGVMTRSEMLAMYFVHDGGNTSKWRLKGHATDVFWQWMSSWAVVITNPRDLDYEVEGYDLPKLNIHEIIVDGDKPIVETLTLTQRRQARKESLEERCKAAADLVNNSNENWLVWCNLNDESKLLHELINDSVEVKGSDKAKHKTDSSISFANGDIKCLVSKPLIFGMGLNFQSCHNMIFVGLSDSYEQYYQAVRRCWRFGQEHEVNVYIVISAKEGCVKENIERKQEEANTMQQEMLKHTKEITKENIKATCRISTPYNNNLKMILPVWREFKNECN
ncbi:helicase-related protein [Clostridium sp. HCP1S3_A12]|uniref:helicase-related protein n=1 Tax=unclassified Clostridium TaxID=2614128 RepID=UPI003F892BA9